MQKAYNRIRMELRLYALLFEVLLNVGKRCYT